MKILIVDDKKDNLRVTADMARFIGYESVMANNGYQALEILEAEDIPILLIDWMMPQMDGIELINRVRSQFSERRMYVIMLTAKGTPEDIATGRESGVDDYMVKPFLPGDLKRRLAAGEAVLEAEPASTGRPLPTHDHLTGVYNRRRFRELAAEALLNAERAMLIAANIDQLNTINQTQGYPTGDRILRSLAQIFERVAPDGSLVGRYQLDVLLMLIPSAEGADHIVEQIRDQFGAGQPGTTMSIGIAAQQNPALDSLVDSVAEALQAAKSRGGNSVEQI